MSDRKLQNVSPVPTMTAIGVLAAFKRLQRRLRWQGRLADKACIRCGRRPIFTVDGVTHVCPCAFRMFVELSANRGGKQEGTRAICDGQTVEVFSDGPARF